MKKKVFLSAIMAVMTMLASAQDNPYIVKTKNVKKVVETSAATDNQTNSADADGPQDFLGKNFRYYSMCEWNNGMRFMVIPEKYDLLVNAFHDANTGKEVSSSLLRHHIMVYRGHEDMPNGRVFVRFFCETDNKDYYYELPNGTFDDYCLGKLGVPTLAYLGDVDRARDLLMDQYLLLRSQYYREDTEYDGDGFREVVMPKNKVVKVVAVGVGTRSFPVKVIVEDEDGKQFYQIVAMSKTNSGLRDNEFDVDNAKHLFENSFEFTGADMVVSKNIMDYLNQTVHTKISTLMSSRGSGKVRDVKVPRFTGFIIDEIRPVRGTEFYTLTLRETDTRRIYYKDIAFDESAAEGKKDDYFGSLFGMGEGQLRSTTLETRTAIREGRVIPGMTEEEVEMAVGEPVSKITTNGVTEWLYNRSNGVLLVVQFDEEGIVKKASGRSGKPGGKGSAKQSRRSLMQTSSGQQMLGSGSPL